MREWNLETLLALLALALLAAVSACGGSERDRTGEPWVPPGPDTELHPVTIAAPPSAGGLATPYAQVSGEPVSIGCPTCHVEGRVAALAPPAKEVEGPFHAGVEIEHGDLACASCHVDGEPHQLRVASGDTFPIRDSMRLCSQCHGPIRKAYDHGAHGGMRGYWDLQRGPRTRNACIACHSPHQPAYPKVTPMPGPKDRFGHTQEPPGSLVERRYPQEEHE